VTSLRPATHGNLPPMTAEEHSSPAVVPHRGLITASVMLASILQALDTTIANVALPRMRGSLSATQEQMAWVLTSYIVAAAIMTPLTGWLANRIGRKRLFLLSVIGFTIASALCGLAQSVNQIVTFRLLQGICGASLIPIAQAVLFDINPPEHHGRAMSIWGTGVMLGPMLGPVLGGWLTDNYSWRWVFYINVPFGILAVLGIITFLQDSKRDARPFDFFGFVTLAIAVGTLQMLLDRGSLLDWFSAREIQIYAASCGLSLYLFIVHTTTADHSFIRLSLYRDRNFLAGSLLIFVIGVVMYATLALLPPMLQELMHYSVLQAGLVTAPRGVGALVAMYLAGRLIGKFDIRLIVGIGLIITAFSLWQMTHFSPLMDIRPLVISGLIQGLGSGLVMVPLAALPFVTIPRALRNEGTALFSLVRNLGFSVGISATQAFLVSNTQIVHAYLAARVTPWALASQHLTALRPGAALAALNAEVTAQATMIAYLDDFELMLILTLLTLPLLLLVRSPALSKEQRPLAME
jgi:MFS transporter, DHA2 family, multidrug resistance protein